MKKLLHIIKEESAKYNMRLNKDKCTTIAMNKNNQITFQDGTRVQNEEDTVYLGTTISQTMNNHKKINSRIAAASAIARRLKMVWKEAHIPVK